MANIVDPTPKIVALTNEKGGVGKTTLSVNLAASAACDYGLRVLFLDMDPQCNATARLLQRSPSKHQGEDGGVTIGTFLRGQATLPEVICQSPLHERLYHIPGDRDLEMTTRGILRSAAEAQRLSGANVDLDAIEEEYLRHTRRAIRTQIPTDFDLVVMDTPPNRGTMPLLIGLSCSDSVMLVAKPDLDSIAGIGAILTVTSRLANVLGSRIRMQGLIMNMVKANRPKEAEIIAMYRQKFGPLVYHEEIPDRAGVASHNDRDEAVTLSPGQSGARSEAGRMLRVAAGSLLVRLGIVPREVPRDLLGRMPDFEPGEAE